MRSSNLKRANIFSLSCIKDESDKYMYDQARKGTIITHGVVFHSEKCEGFACDQLDRFY